MHWSAACSLAAVALFDDTNKPFSEDYLHKGTYALIASAWALGILN